MGGPPADGQGRVVLQPPAADGGRLGADAAGLGGRGGGTGRLDVAGPVQEPARRHRRRLRRPLLRPARHGLLPAAPRRRPALPLQLGPLGRRQRRQHPGQ